MLHTTLQEDLSSLLRGLCGYRETLRNDAQKAEFSGLWGLADSGHFITSGQDLASSTAESTSIWFRPRAWLSKATAGDSKVQEAITTDLKTVRGKLEMELEDFSKMGQKARGGFARESPVSFVFVRFVCF
jgi:hypothetical protein